MIQWKWPSLDVAKSATQRSILGCGMDDVGQHTHDASNASCFRSKSVWNNISGPILMTLQILCDNSNWLSGKFCHRPQFIRRRTVCNESRIGNVRSGLQAWHTFLLKQDHIKWHQLCGACRSITASPYKCRSGSAECEPRRPAGLFCKRPLYSCVVSC